MALRLVFLGPPGAGKGTIASKAAEKFGLPHIATGDLLRKEVAMGTAFGKKAKPFMQKGELAQDEIVTAVLRKRLEEKDADKGFILDGYPRTMRQAEMLEEILKELNDSLSAVLHIFASEETIIKRLGNRRQCRECGKVYNLVTMPAREEGKCDVCGQELFQRKDDKPETIKNRLQVYRARTEPIIEHYRERGLLKKADCDAPLQENLRTVYAILDGIK